MTYQKSAIGLCLFLVAATVATWMVFVTLRREVPGDTNVYSATFTDVSGLKTGDDVRVAGVRVGRVDAVELDGTQAKVTLRVQRDQTLYDDTIASITYQNIIGQRYVGLLPGTGPRHGVLANHGHIPVQHTSPSFDISYLLNGFEPLFTLLNAQQVDDLTNGLIQALQGDSGSVLALINQTSALAETFAGPDAMLGDVIKNLNEVTAALARQNDNLVAVIANSRRAVTTLADRRAELVESTGSIAHAVDRLSTIVGNIRPDLHAFITREPGLLGLWTGEGKNRFAFWGTNLVLVLKGLSRATQSGSYVDGYICDINSTVFAFLGRVIPGVVRLASPGNMTEHSPICR